MSLQTLLLLQRCLRVQQMSVGDPAFPAMAREALTALEELDQAIVRAQQEAGQVQLASVQR